MSPISFIRQALTFLFPLILLSTQVLADTWAVLIASSNGFWNYRHQADIFHSYHVLVNNGVNPAKIILFAFNDIVNDPNNPYPGQLFNIPSYNNPVDVYAGIQVDYNTTQVTSTNFLNVLMGNTSAGLPKVLKSTKDDNVFIYFVDHGVTGGLMFPNGVLWADQLIQTLTYMNSEEMYGNLVFYVEACNSGSIFSQLPTNLSIYAVSASNSSQPSFATFCPPQDYVYNKEIGTCLADLFSINWMLSAQTGNIETETLEDQFEEVKNLTTASQVLAFGNLSIDVMPIGDFEGNLNNKNKKSEKIQQNSEYNMNERIAKYEFFKTKYQMTGSPTYQELMQKELNSMQWFDRTFAEIRHYFDINPNQIIDSYDFDCLRDFFQLFTGICQPFTEYGGMYVQDLAVMCWMNIDRRSVLHTFYFICSHSSSSSDF